MINMNVFLDAKQARELTEANRQRIGQNCWIWVQDKIAKRITEAATSGMDQVYIPIYHLYYENKQYNKEGYNSFVNICSEALVKLGYNTRYLDTPNDEIYLIVSW